MEAQTIQHEFDQYWSKLSAVEKQSLLIVAKTFVHSREEKHPISIEQYNKEIEEAMQQMDAGEYYTHAEVGAMSKKWLNGK